MEHSALMSSHRWNYRVSAEEKVYLTVEDGEQPEYSANVPESTGYAANISQVESPAQMPALGGVVVPHASAGSLFLEHRRTGQTSRHSPRSHPLAFAKDDSLTSGKLQPRQKYENNASRQFFIQCNSSIQNIATHARQSGEKIYALNDLAIRRILKRVAICDIPLLVVAKVMKEIKLLYYKSNATIKLVYELRSQYPRGSLSLPAVSKSGMDAVLASELRRLLNVDCMGEPDRSRKVRARRIRHRRWDIWGASAEVRSSEVIRKAGMVRLRGSPMSSPIPSSPTIVSQPGFETVLPPGKGEFIPHMARRFARIGGKLLAYEPLAMRLRDLWYGTDVAEGNSDKVGSVRDLPVMMPVILAQDAQRQIIEKHNHDEMQQITAGALGNPLLAKFLMVAEREDQMSESSSPNNSRRLVEITHPFGSGIWSIVNDPEEVFQMRLPLELNEFSSLERRRQRRIRSQLWMKWQPRHAAICEEWAQSRWDIIRDAREYEVKLRAKEGFRSLDDEGEENVNFHRYFQTVTRQMHTYVPPYQGNFDPPKWAPDVRSVVEHGGGVGGAGVPPSINGNSLLMATLGHTDTNSVSGHLNPHSVITTSSVATIPGLDGLQDQHDRMVARALNAHPRCPAEWRKEISKVSMDIREHVRAVLVIVRAQTGMLLQKKSVESMSALAAFIEQYRTPVTCEEHKAEVHARSRRQKQEEARILLKRQEEEALAQRLAGGGRMKRKGPGMFGKSEHSSSTTAVKGIPTLGTITSYDDDKVTASVYQTPPRFQSYCDEKRYSHLRPLIKCSLRVVQSTSKDGHNEWCVVADPPLDGLERVLISSIDDMAALSNGFVSPRVGPAYESDIEATWNIEDRERSLVMSMSLQGLPDPHIVAARLEKIRVLAEQKAALDALEKKSRPKNAKERGASMNNNSHGNSSMDGKDVASSEYTKISVDDAMADEDEQDVYAMEAEMQDNKFWFIQEAQLSAKGIGGSGARSKATSPLEDQLRKQMGLVKKKAEDINGEKVRFEEWLKDPQNDDYYDNFQIDVMDEKWGVIGRGPNVTPPPIHVGGVHIADDMNVQESRKRVQNIISRTKPWLDGLINSFTPYLDELYAPSEEIELREFLDAFLHGRQGAAAAVTVPGDLSSAGASEKQDSSENSFDLSLEGLATRVDRYIALADAAAEHAKHIEHIPCGIVETHVEECKQAIRRRALELADVLLDGCKKRLMQVCATLDAEYSSIETKVKRPPKTSQELFDKRTYMKKVENVELPRLSVAFHHPKRGVKKFLFMLQGRFGQRCRFQERETELVSRVYQWPGHITNTVLVLATGVCDMFAQTKVNLLQLERIDLEKELREVSSGVRAMRKRECRVLEKSMLPSRKKGSLGIKECALNNPESDDVRNGNSEPDPELLGHWQSSIDYASAAHGVGAGVSRAASLREKLTSCMTRSDEVLQEELRLGQPTSDYGHQVLALSKSLKAHEGAWGDLRKYLQIRETCYGARVTTLVGTVTIQQVTDIGQRMVRWQNSEKLKDAHNLLRALRGAAEEIKCFQHEHASLLEMVATDGLESRSWWDSMGTVITNSGRSLGHADDQSVDGANMQRDSRTVLADAFQEGCLNMASLIDLRLHEHTDIIAPICHRAKMQRALELELDAMCSTWGNSELAWLEMKNLEKMKAQAPWQYVAPSSSAERKHESNAECGGHPVVVELSQTSVDKVEIIIEEQLTHVKVLQGSPFVGPHLRRCYQWEARLDQAEIVLLEWCELQNAMGKFRRIAGLAVFGASGDISEGLETKRQYEIGRLFSELDNDFMDMQIEVRDAEGTFIANASKATAETAEQPHQFKEGTDVDRNAIGHKMFAPTLSILGGVITPRRLSTLKTRLEIAKQKLRKEIESRCGAFPRLWLLSKNQIFKLLVDSRSKTDIQQHLPLVFPGMSGIMFGSGEEDDSSTAGYIDAGDITAIYCDDGEMIGLAKRSAGELEGMRQHLHNILSPDVVADELAFRKVLNDGAYINPERQRSPIEVWLRQLETEMRRAVAAQIDGAVRAWPTLKMAIQSAERLHRKKMAQRTAVDLPDPGFKTPSAVSKASTFKWIRRWPIQAVCLASEIHWTQNVARALRTGEQSVKRKLQAVLDNHRIRMGQLVEGLLESNTAVIPFTHIKERAKARRHLAKLTSSLMCSRHQEDILVKMIRDIGDLGSRPASTSLASSKLGEHSDAPKQTAKLGTNGRTRSNMRNFERTERADALLQEGTQNLAENPSDVAVENDKALTFFWLAQVRHGFRKSTSKKRNAPGIASTRVFNVSLDHGGEVFGSQTMRRIVIMPLTERCYQSVLMSVAPAGAHGGSGAVLKGPTGIGKTETLQQLAQECGVCCPLVNGSDQIAKPGGIVRLVRAVAGTGNSWLLLDNIARIPMAVLSILGHALTSLRRAHVTGIALTPGGSGGYQDSAVPEEIRLKKESMPMHKNMSKVKQVYLTPEVINQNGILQDFFDFNGNKSVIRPGGCIVATFDFDHEERSEKARRQLPENLALFFRPCTMLSVPGDNLALVAEVMLMTGGFQESYAVAKRLCTLHTCAEQLLGGAGLGEEHQQHYNFTFSSLISVLRLSCATLLQSDMIQNRLESLRFYANPSVSGTDSCIRTSAESADEMRKSMQATSVFLKERQIVATAWIQVHNPMLTNSLDRRRARHLVTELLLHKSNNESNVLEPTESTGENSSDLLQVQQPKRPEMIVLERICHQSYIAPEPSFLNMVYDLHNNLDSWNAALVLGKPHTGKSCAIKLLANALPSLANLQSNTASGGLNQSSQSVTSIAPFVLNPMALTLTALFGTGSAPQNDSDPCGGLLRHTLLRCCESAREDPQEQQWLIFDGPVDSSWIDGMNTMFGSSRALCLSTGESIPIPQSTKLIFETCSISDATPSVISRMGVVSIGDAVLSWRSMLHIWVESFEARSESNRSSNTHEGPTSSRTRTNVTPQMLRQKTKERRRGSVASIGHTNLPGEAGAGKHASRDIGHLSPKASSDLPHDGSILTFRRGMHISKLFEAWLEPCVGLMSPGGALSVHLFGDADAVDALSFARSILHVMDVLLDPLIMDSTLDEPRDDISVEKRQDSHHFDAVFMCSLACALGAYVDSAGRRKFSVLYRQALSRGAWVNVLPSLDKYLNSLTPAYGAGEEHDLGSPEIPEGFDLFDLFYDLNNGEWRPWLSRNGKNTSTNTFVQSYRAPLSRPSSANLHTGHMSSPAHARQWGSIYVPNSETAALEFWAEKLLRRGCPVMLRGPTGGGKTALAKHVLTKLEESKEFSRTISVHFSLHTSAEELQLHVDRRMQRRKKGYFEPAHGKKGVLFIDDVHSPAPSALIGEVSNFNSRGGDNRTSGAGRAKTVEVVELLRQLLSNGGWYDAKTMDFRRIEKITLLAAATDIRRVSVRFSHHLVPLALVGLDDPVIVRRLFHYFLSTGPGDIRNSKSSQNLTEMLADATMDVYNACLKHLRPTPIAPHYVFSARDVGNMLEGIKLATTGLPRTNLRNHESKSDGQSESTYIYDQKDVAIRLWAHEVLRVFHDRLVSDEDRIWLLRLVKKTTTDRFQQNFDELLAHLDADGDGTIDEDELLSLHFNSMPEQRKPANTGAKINLANMFKIDESSSPNEDNWQYRERQDPEALLDLLSSRANDYDKDARGHSKRPMRLVVFHYAVEHLCRIMRVLNLDSGHMILVGLGGSGRQSLTRLATFCAGHRLMHAHDAHEYDWDRWRHELWQVLVAASSEPVVFLLTQTHLRFDGMLSDLAAVVRGGDLNSLAPEDVRQKNAGTDSRPRTAQTTSSSINSYAHPMLDPQALSSNLHVIMCLSPAGPKFRDTVRRYQSLRNCCTIDWFGAWPMDALSAVARGKLDGLELDIADVAAKRRLSEAAKIREAKKRLERNKLEKRVKRKSRQELRRSFRRGLKMQRMLGMMKVKVEDLGNTLNPAVGTQGDSVGENNNDDKASDSADAKDLHSEEKDRDDQSETRAGRALAFEKKRRAALKEATKRRVKKLQTASLLSGIYFKSKTEQMSILYESIIETALVFHVQARSAASPIQKGTPEFKNANSGSGDGGGGSRDEISKNGVGASVDLSRSNKSTSTAAASENREKGKNFSQYHSDKKKDSHHVMPAKFLEFLSLYTALLTREQDRVLERKHRFEVGVQKLGMASAEVTEMNTQIDRMTPMLEEAQVHTARVMKRLDDARPAVEKKRAVVRLDEKRATKEAEKVARTKLECEADLKVALPMLSEAMKALDTISSKDISNLKSMANPPEGVKLVLEAVCIMLKVDPKRKTNRGTGEVSLDYWKPAKKLMGDTHFLDKLREYDKDNIPSRIVRQVRETYVPMDAFAPENVKRASSAAEGMCKWILAMLEYDRVLNFIRPKRAALEDSEKTLQKTLMDLGSKRRALREVEDELAQLQQEYDAAVERADRLINTLKLCELKVQRARDLLKGLGGEAEKWTESAHELSKRSVLLVGDMLLSAAVVTYTGIMSENHRKKTINGWINECTSRGIDHTRNWSLRRVLGQPERDREWVARGLPNDDYHVENAIIVEEAQRFPLMIDPQGQARRWLRSAFRDAGVMTTMLSDASFEATLCAGIVQGHPVLLENMDEAMENASSGSKSSNARNVREKGRSSTSLAASDAGESEEQRDPIQDPPNWQTASSSSGSQLLFLPPELEPILLHQLDREHRDQIHFSDKVLTWHPNFKLFLATKRANPHFPPGVVALVTVLDFSITPAGLEHVLLSDIVRRERSDLEDKSGHVRLGLATCGVRLDRLEREILRVMAASEGNLLEDENAIQTLKNAQEERDEVMKGQANLKAEMIKLDKQREPYRGLAAAVSPHFFILQDMSRIRSIYQYSLPLFMDWFGEAIRESEHSDKIGRRIRMVIKQWNQVLVENATASFFERDEIVFLLRMAIVAAAKSQSEEAMTGRKGKNKKKKVEVSIKKEEPVDNGETRVSESEGYRIRAMSALFERRLAITPFSTKARAEMPEVAASTSSDFDLWEQFWNGKTNSCPVKSLSTFDQLLAVRFFAPPQYFPSAVRAFCSEILGEESVQPRTVELKEVLRRSTNTIPVIMFAEPGSSIDLAPLARAHRQSVVNVPMGGKDEAMTAMKAIQFARKSGTWVLLESIHLCGKFLGLLSRVFEDIVEAGEEIETKKEIQQIEKTLESLHASPVASPTSAKTEAVENNGQTKPRRRRKRRSSTTASAADAARAVLQKSENEDAFFRIRGKIHEHFRLWCVARPVEHFFPVSMLQESICVIIEAVTGLRSNVLQSLATAPMSRRAFWDVELEDGGRNGDGSRSLRLFDLVWFHALCVSRGTFGALGFSGGPYVLTAGLELGLGVRQLEMAHSVEVCQSGASEKGSVYITASKEQKVLLSGYLITELHYGGHVGDPEDRTILGALWKMSQNAAASIGSEEIGYRSLDQHRMFVRSMHPEPVLPGLAPGAALSRQVVECNYLVERFMSATHLGEVIVSLGKSLGEQRQAGTRSRGPSLATADSFDKLPDTDSAGIVAAGDLSPGKSGAALDDRGRMESEQLELREQNEEHVVEWTKQWDSVRQQIVDVIGERDLAAYVDGAHHVGRHKNRSFARVVSAGRPFGVFEGENLFPDGNDGYTSQFRRVIQRERIALESLRVKIGTTVGIWTEIMLGKVDNRRLASVLEIAVGRYETPQEWRMWGGDWSLCSELKEFLALLNERQEYWRHRWVCSSRRVWWGVFSRPAAVLGAVIVDSGHGWELGGLGDVVGKVWHHRVGAGRPGEEIGYESEEIEAISEEDDLGSGVTAEKISEHALEDGAIVIEGLWLLGCQWSQSGHIIDDADGSGGDGRVAAPDVLLRRKHESDERLELRKDHISVPIYAHRGSSVLSTVPLPLAEDDVGVLGKDFFSLRGVKILVL
jgi:hypothetical protein